MDHCWYRILAVYDTNVKSRMNLLKKTMSNNFWTLIQPSSSSWINNRLHSSKSALDWEFFPAHASHLDKVYLLQKQLTSVKQIEIFGDIWIFLVCTFSCNNNSKISDRKAGKRAVWAFYTPIHDKMIKGCWVLIMKAVGNSDHQLGQWIS